MQCKYEDLWCSAPLIVRAHIHERALPVLNLKFKTFVLSMCRKSAKTFAIGLVVFTKNLRPVLGLAKGITLSLPVERLKYYAKLLELCVK